MSKIKTALRLAVTPSAYPFLWRRALATVGLAPSSLESTGKQAAAWCRRQAQSQKNGSPWGDSAGRSSLEALFPEVMQDAQRRVAQCPQKMGGAGAMGLLYDLARHFHATRIIETGVAYGWSSLALLLAMKDKPGARLVSTNLHYREYGDDSHVGCAVPQDLRAGWTIVPEADSKAIPKALAMLPEIDLCHYDSDKSYAGRMQAYPLLWKALRVGGCFVSDDIDDNLAFAHFCTMTRHAPTVLSMPASGLQTRYVGVLIKDSNAPLRRVIY